MGAFEAQKKEEQASRIPFQKKNGFKIPDMLAYVQEWLEQHPVSELHVGCDSKSHQDSVKFSTVICMREIGNGVHEIYRNEYEHRPMEGTERLWNEVTKAVSIADQLRTLRPVTVHVDLNSDPRFRSNKIYDASIGLIKGMGFEALGKPDAWAATCGANKHCE